MATDRADTASSCFSTLVRDTDTGEVVMVFIRGGVYSIANLPDDVWAAWKASASLGSFFNTDVKGNY